jgi:hypothetical protein
MDRLQTIVAKRFRPALDTLVTAFSYGIKGILGEWALGNVFPKNRILQGCRMLPFNPSRKQRSTRRLPRSGGLLAAISLMICAPGIGAADSRDEIKGMEQKWAEAVEHNDPDEIGSFLEERFTFVNPRGMLLHREEHLDDFRQKRTVFAKVALSEIVIRVYGDDAVVTSRPKITGFAVTPAGKMSFDATPARFTDTLIRRNGKWQSVARQMSLVSE